MELDEWDMMCIDYDINPVLTGFLRLHAAVKGRNATIKMVTDLMDWYNTQPLREASLSFYEMDH